MLETFLPLVTKDVRTISLCSHPSLTPPPQTILAMVPVLTSFLPMRCVDQYLPALFTIFESFNSHIIDARMIELAGELAEEHVAGLAGDAGEQGMCWRDVGIWTQDQWTFLVGKCLGNMSGFCHMYASHMH